MARTRSLEAPAQSDVYFGMVLCSFFAILVAIGLLVWEMTDYGWTSTPTAIAAPNLPKVPTRAPENTPTAMAPVVEQNKPAVAALTPSETPAPAPAVIPAPIVPPVVAVKPETPAPVAAPSPIPSTLVISPKPTTPTAPPAPAPVEAPKPTSSGPVPGFQLPKR